MIASPSTRPESCPAQSSLSFILFEQVGLVENLDAKAWKVWSNSNSCRRPADENLQGLWPGLAFALDFELIKTTLMGFEFSLQDLILALSLGEFPGVWQAN